MSADDTLHASLHEHIEAPPASAMGDLDPMAHLAGSEDDDTAEPIGFKSPEEMYQHDDELYLPDYVFELPASTNDVPVARSQTGVRKSYRVKSEVQLAALNKAFEENSRPSSEALRALAQRLGMSFDEAQRWFRDRRSALNKRSRAEPPPPPPAPHVVAVDDDTITEPSPTPPPRETSATAPQTKRPRVHSPADSTRQALLSAFDHLPLKARDRNDALLELVRRFTAGDRRHVLQLLTPRVGSAALQSASAPARRAKEAWAMLAHLFGAAQTPPTGELDANMLAGLTGMFRTHREYLAHLARELLGPRPGDSEKPSSAPP